MIKLHLQHFLQWTELNNYKYNGIADIIIICYVRVYEHLKPFPFLGRKLWTAFYANFVSMHDLTNQPTVVITEIKKKSEVNSHLRMRNTFIRRLVNRYIHTSWVRLLIQ